MKNVGFQKAIEMAGGQAKFADLLGDGTVQSTISKWDDLPAEYVLRVEDRTGIPRYEIRPDLYPQDHPQ